MTRPVPGTRSGPGSAPISESWRSSVLSPGTSTATRNAAGGSVTTMPAPSPATGTGRRDAAVPGPACAARRGDEDLPDRGAAGDALAPRHVRGSGVPGVPARLADQLRRVDRAGPAPGGLYPA